MEKTFKQLNNESTIEKEIKKAGLSLCIIFNKDELAKFNLEYGDKIRLYNAEIIKSKSI